MLWERSPKRTLPSDRGSGAGDRPCRQNGFCWVRIKTWVPATPNSPQKSCFTPLQWLLTGNQCLGTHSDISARWQRSTVCVTWVSSNSCHKFTWGLTCCLPRPCEISFTLMPCYVKMLCMNSYPLFNLDTSSPPHSPPYHPMMNADR